MRRITISLLSLVVLAVLFFTLCTFTRKPYEAVLLVRFGKIVEPTRIAYNWYLQLPTDSVVRLDQRVHVYQSKDIQNNTASAEPVLIRTFAAWRIEDPNLFYRTLQGSDERAQAFLDAKVSGQVAGILGRHALEELFNQENAAQVTAGMEKEIAEKANEDLKHQGLQVVSVGFARMGFPPEVAQKVYGRMAAERLKLAQDFRSKGMSAAAEIRGKAEQQASQIVSAAQSQAQQIRGEGDATAIKLLADAQGTPEAEEFYRFWKTMEILKSSLTKSTVLVITPGDPLLTVTYNFLNQPHKASASAPESTSAATQPAISATH